MMKNAPKSVFKFSLPILFGLGYPYIAHVAAQPTIEVDNSGGQTNIKVSFNTLPGEGCEQDYHIVFSNPRNQMKLIVINANSTEIQSSNKYQGFLTYDPDKKTVQFSIDAMIYKGNRLAKLQPCLNGEYGFD